jgi:hypothetical protein
MNIVILNGNPDDTNHSFDRYLELYRVRLHKTGHYVRSFLLRDMQIKDLRISGFRNNPDPGFIMDDFRYIANAVSETDLIVMTSPLEQGFVSILAKMVQDRLSRFLLPKENKPASVMRLTGNENKMPLLALILQKEPNTVENDVLLNRLAGETMAANLHTLLSFCVTMDSDITETLHKTWKSMDYHFQVEQTFNGFISGVIP